MTLRKTGAIFRFLVGIALALGFVGFATHSHHAAQVGSVSPQVVEHRAPALTVPSLVASGPSQLGL